MAVILVVMMVVVLVVKALVLELVLAPVQVIVVTNALDVMDVQDVPVVVKADAMVVLAVLMNVMVRVFRIVAQDAKKLATMTA